MGNGVCLIPIQQPRPVRERVTNVVTRSPSGE